MKLFIRLLTLLMFLALTAVITLLLARSYLDSWGDKPLEVVGQKVITVERGVSLRKLSEQLYQSGVVSHPRFFEFWVKFYSQFERFQAGPYLFEGSLTPKQVASKIISGDIHQPVLFQMTIPEGFTIQQIANRMERFEIAPAEQIIKLSYSKDFLSRNRVPSSSLEGFAYPATYYFMEMPTAHDVLTMMVQTFWAKLPADYEERVGEMGLSLKEAVTFASLIELETRLDQERPMVAEVIWNRLNSRMALAIDASIIYGIENFDGNIRTVHLHDRDNPYNTRLHPGLPPTPIGAPSIESLMAVLSPTDHGYYYYVLDLKDGSKHIFTKTLREHNRHVQELMREQRRIRLEAERAN